MAVTPPLRVALTEYIRRPDVNYRDVQRRTGLNRTTVQRIAGGKTPTTSKAKELHELVGLPPPDRSPESRALDAFRTITALDAAYAETLAADLEGRAASLKEAAREEIEAAETQVRATRRRQAARTGPLPPPPARRVH